MRNTLSLTSLALLFAFSANAAPRAATRTKSVILIVADGLGPSLQEALRMLDGPLAVDAFPHAVLTRTSAANDLVTDSAAAATALATGRKTNKGMVGMAPDGTPLPTVAELAAAAGKRVGLVTTASLWDATPSAFLAHQASRDDQDGIVAQVLAAKPALLYGGGERNLVPAGKAGRFGPGARKDGRDLLAAFRSAGYAIVTQPAPKPLPQLGVFASGDLFSTEPAVYSPPVSLPAMAAAAMAALEASPAGFFLLIEEEGTDAMMHGSSVTQALDAARRWNQTVALAVEFQRKHPETAVFVAADHETGAFMIAPPEACDAPLGRIDGTAFATKYGGALESTRALVTVRDGRQACFRAHSNRHTATPTVLYMLGAKPPATAVIENTAVNALLREALGLR